ncbi:MAG: hypothetical protein WC476_01100 [Phycisphaerae bacterium]|jgi:hypothetical protein
MGIVKRELEKTYIDIPLKASKIRDCAIASAKESPDLLTIDFILCNEGVNGRGDRFNSVQLGSRYWTAEYKGINWEHNQPFIGCISKASVKTNGEGLKYVDCQGKLWKFIYEDFTDLISQAMASDNPQYDVDLAFISMEAWFPTYNMIVGEYEETYPKGDAYAEELHEKRGTHLDDGRLVSRELLDIIFGAAAITSSPADKGALIKSAASKRSIEEYHEYLHAVYSGKRQSPFKPEEIIEEHTRLHKQNPEKFLRE